MSLDEDKSRAREIANSLETGGAGVWPTIPPEDVAESLRQRIDHPEKIRQAMTPYCGPAAFAYLLASSQPILYAQAVAELYRNGKTVLPGEDFSGYVI
jgi:hypothetical protein